MLRGLFLFAFLIVPVLEIAVFIAIGGQIGLWPTLGLIIVTAFIGTFLLRQQGISLIREIQEKLNRNEVPGRALVHGVMLVAAGVLLLTPGFVTDTVGFLLFIPALRERIWMFLKSRVTFVRSGMGRSFDETRSSGPAHPEAGKSFYDDIIDLDESEYGPADPNSPWKKPPE